MKRTLAIALTVCMLLSLVGCGAKETTNPEDITLTVWYWGEQDNPGMKPFMEEAAKLYTEKTGIAVEAILQESDTLYSAFRTAEEAGEGPDIQYLWGGTLALEDVWLDHLDPFGDYFTEEELGKFTADSLAETNWDGKQWGIPTYRVCTGFAYNKEMFAAAGLDPENPYTTWDEFLACCKALKDAGYTPIGAGIKDGFLAGWLAFNLAQQNLDARADLLPFLLGEESYAEEKYSEWIVRIKELIDLGYVNDDIQSLDFYQGQQLLQNEQCAMTLLSSNYTSTLEKSMGADKIGMLRPPVYGDGELATTFAAFCDAWVLPKSAKHKKEAADFLRFLQEPDMMKLLYDKSNCIVPHENFDMNWLSTEVDKEVNGWFEEYRGLTYQFFYPPTWEYSGLTPAIQLLLTDTLTLEECYKTMDDAIAEWRMQSPDQVEAFKKY